MRAVAFIIRVVLSDIIRKTFVVGATPLSYEVDKSLIVGDDIDYGKMSQEKVFGLFKEKAHRDGCGNTQGHNYGEVSQNYRSARSPVVLKKNMNISTIQKSEFEPDSKSSFPDPKSLIAVEDQEHVLSSRYGNIPFVCGLLKHESSLSSLAPASYSKHYIIRPMAVTSRYVHKLTPNIKQVHCEDQIEPSVRSTVQTANLGRVSELAWSELVYDTIMPNILPTMPISFTRQQDYGISHCNSPLLAVFPKK